MSVSFKRFSRRDNTTQTKSRSKNARGRVENARARELLPSSRLANAASHCITTFDLPGVVLVKWLLMPVVVSTTLIGVTKYHGYYFDEHYLILCIFSFLVSSHVFDTVNLYRLHDRFPFLDAVATVIWKWLITSSLVVFFAYAVKMLPWLSLDVMVTWLVITPVVLLVFQYLTRKVLEAIVTKTVIRKAVILGGNALGVELCEKMHGDPYLSIDVEGFFDDRSADRLPEHVGDKLLGKLTDVAHYVRQQGIDLVYISLPMSLQGRLHKVLEELHDTTASVYFVPDIFVFDLIQARFDQVNGVPVVAVCDTPFFGIRGISKRMSDIVLASAILLLISPVLCLIAIGVKCSSRGPVIFRQRRYGLDGREIYVYKFRSMTVCEDGNKVVQARKNDQRVTRFGRFLRRTSLDELPQFINVLQGRMSIVGPRPHAVAHNEMYRKVIKGYMMRHKVKPGITGWAQVNGLRGETDSLDKMQARIQYDLDYLRNWSLGLDFRIILRTVSVVLGDRNAF